MSKKNEDGTPRSEEVLLEEAGYAFAQPAADDLLDAVARGDLDRARRIVRSKPQYFSEPEVEILVQRLARDEKTDRERYPELVSYMEILHAVDDLVGNIVGTHEQILGLLNSSEAPQAIGRLKRERVWRHDEIPFVRQILQTKKVLK